MHYETVTKTDKCIYGLREKYFRCMFIIPPPGLASSSPLYRNFSKVVRFSNTNFPEVAPQKNLSAYFSPNYYTAPVPSLTPWSSRETSPFAERTGLVSIFFTKLLHRPSPATILVRKYFSKLFSWHVQFSFSFFRPLHSIIPGNLLIGLEVL